MPEFVDDDLLVNHLGISSCESVDERFIFVFSGAGLGLVYGVDLGLVRFYGIVIPHDADAVSKCRMGDWVRK
jgi:hypothetical protein